MGRGRADGGEEEQCGSGDCARAARQMMASLSSHGKPSVPAETWDLRPRRSGRKEGFGRPLKAAGLGAVEGGSRLDHGLAERGMGHNGGSRQDGLSAVADGVATIGIGMAGIAAIESAVDVTSRGRVGRGRMVSSMRRGVTHPRRLRLVLTMARRVRVRARAGGQQQRKRSDGCKQPCRP
jgi:hypothetical protein